ncbi:MAG: tRNA (guanosine(37)-N1)-methyltransferase TrmD [Myxococcota bacterium]|jgi:tRNA (guanine37-N1)-methyltransferase|nr:tRNA (guanosine(37)-N1)-methyltransferase TrmD [Myxococcota bacterium]
MIESPARRIHVLTLFPAFFGSALQQSIVARALKSGRASVHLHDIRDACTDRHRSADDSPFGGGAGMVMKAEPIVASMEAVQAQWGPCHRILLAAHGTPLKQTRVQELAQMPALLLLCGHYEGVDERVADGFIDETISLGDYVLTGGEPAALVLMDAVIRLYPGVLGNEDSARDESFSMSTLLEYPQYTRPAVFRGRHVPEVLISGDHARIARWRREQSLLRTKRYRPELFRLHFATLDAKEQARLSPLLAKHDDASGGEQSAVPDQESASSSVLERERIPVMGEKIVDMADDSQQNVASVGLDEGEPP